MLSPPRSNPYALSAALTCLALAIAACPLAAQVPFELTYRVREQQVVTVDSPAELLALSQYERSGIRSGEPETYEVHRTYSPDRGLRDVRTYDVPKRSDVSWWRQPIARLEQTPVAVTAYGSDGAVIQSHAFDQGNRSAGYQLAAQAAERELGHPFPKSVVPDPAERERLTAEGYTLLDPNTLQARSGTPDRQEQDLANLAIPADVVDAEGEVLLARAADHAVLFDGRAQLRSYTRYGEAGQPVYHGVRRYRAVDLADGTPGLLLVDEITMTLDTLLSGTVVTRATIRRRSDYRYERNGRDGFGREHPTAKVDDLGVFPNPLTGDQLFLSLPQTGRDGGFTLRITAADGRLVDDRVLAGASGELVPVAIGAPLRAGVYTARLCQGGDCWTRLVVAP